VSPIGWSDVDWYNLGREDMPINIDSFNLYRVGFAPRTVICPCCKGAKWLEVEVDLGRFEYPQCCHCQGRGSIPAEVDEEPEITRW